MSETYIKWDNLKEVAESLSVCSDSLNKRREAILSVGKNLSMSENISNTIKAKINDDVAEIEELAGRIEKMSSVLENVANIYKLAEGGYQK